MAFVNFGLVKWGREVKGAGGGGGGGVGGSGWTAHLSPFRGKTDSCE